MNGSSAFQIHIFKNDGTALWCNWVRYACNAGNLYGHQFESWLHRFCQTPSVQLLASAPGKAVEDGSTFYLHLHGRPGRSGFGLAQPRMLQSFGN